MVMVVLLGTWLVAQNSLAIRRCPTQACVARVDPQNPAGNTTAAPQNAPPPAAAQNPAPQQGEAPAETTKEKGADVYVFKKQVDEVVLHATVVDEHNRLVTNLATQ